MSKILEKENQTNNSQNNNEKKTKLLQADLVKDALINSIKKLNPVELVKNPVIFCVELGAILTTIFLITNLVQSNHDESLLFTSQITIWLWFTVIFANFAEAIAESRGKAQADSLRKSKKDLNAKKITSIEDRIGQIVDASVLRKGDLILVEAGSVIAADGEVIKGVASIDESAITGESAPVIRESGGDRSAVIAGTRVLSDWIVVGVRSNPGESFLDKMIELVEGAVRQKTPNEIALSILLISLTIVFLLATATVQPYVIYAGKSSTITKLVSLFVALAPTTIGALLSAIGIAGMNRLLQINVLAFSGRSVEASGDVDIVILDKTGTITLGNRQAAEFIPVKNITEKELAEVAQFASLSDETPEGRSVVILAKERFNIREHNLGEKDNLVFVPFTANSRMSGVDFNGDVIRKGATDSVIEFVKSLKKDTVIPEDLKAIVEKISRSGGTPLVVSKNNQIMGVIYLKDILKGGIKEKIQGLNYVGIKTIMVTGDNPLTAAAISAEAGVSDFVAEAKPEDKLDLIKKYQAQGHMVAMIGDGTNDAPALAQADVGVAMNTGTAAAREAGNMLDLDSNPSKLIQVIEVGKKILITRGSLTTFSIANDIAKYFAILPAMFSAVYPELSSMNIMYLSSPESAVLSAIIFNALVIPALIPLALKGVDYKPATATELLRKNLLVYGLGGIISPFIGIKIIDLVVSFLHLA
ncbi:MAG: potassium-transporting ATPase subunit KdpB [Candidatus Sericytochromatia bacterium]|nr:potassium-transporting ATPase subunit KdpB [Candidatus Sericytochromatia bacterium]